MASEDGLVLLREITAWLYHVRDTAADSGLSLDQLVSLYRLTRLANLIEPSVATQLLSDSRSRDHDDIESEVQKLASFTTGAARHLGDILGVPGSQEVTLDSVRASALFIGLPPLSAGAAVDSVLPVRVQEFAQTIATDVRKNWIVTRELVSIQAVGRAFGSTPMPSSGAGTRNEPWNVRDLVERVYRQVGQWKLGQVKHSGWRKRRDGRVAREAEWLSNDQRRASANRRRAMRSESEEEKKKKEDNQTQDSAKEEDEVQSLSGEDDGLLLF
jgi:hypothetical protein